MSRLIYGYALDECRTKDLEAEAQEFGWTNLCLVGRRGTSEEWILYGEPPVETGDKDPMREPIGSVKIPCAEIVWRSMETQAKADGWSDMMWASDLEVGTLYGRRAVLVKTEPARPAWLRGGEQVIFTASTREEVERHWVDALQSRIDAVDKAVSAGWVALRWVEDRSTGSSHLVGRKMSPPLPAPSVDATSPAYVVDFGKGVGDRDGLPRIRSELGGLMGPGYQATGYEPPPRRQVLLDDPTGDDIAGDAPAFIG